MGLSIFSGFTGHSNSLALDLGNNNTILADAGNRRLSAPSFVALSKGNKLVKAVGVQAYDMLGRVGEDLKVVKPLKGGIIADYEAASMMLNSLMKQAYPSRNYFNRLNLLICGVPYASTEVERRALRDALEQFRARKTYLIFEPLAAAIGMGLNVQEPDGKFLIDIGGGITEIALISLSGIVTHRSLKVAGDSFDVDIQDYFKRQFNLAIGLKQAEQIKIQVGAASETLAEAPEQVCVAGKDISTGIPKVISIGHLEIAYLLNDAISKIEEAILKALEECPPELAGDVYANGIYLSGGSSLLRGLRERLEAKIKVPIHQDDHALDSVTRGITTVMRNTSTFRPVLFR